MKFKILRVISWINFIIVLLLLLVCFIAILYPIVLAAGAVLIIISIFSLLLYPYKDTIRNQNDLHKDQLNDSMHWFQQPKRYYTTRRFIRTIWISLFCMVFSISLMGFLKMHSWYFYLQPLDKELQTYKNIYKERKKHFRPLKRDFEEIK